jgi:hypothetical protein
MLRELPLLSHIALFCRGGGSKISVAVTHAGVSRGRIDDIQRVLFSRIDDIDTVAVPYPGCSGCYVHKGFYDSYKAVANQVVSTLSSYRSQHPHSKVWVMTRTWMVGDQSFLAVMMMDDDKGVDDGDWDVDGDNNDADSNHDK